MAYEAGIAQFGERVARIVAACTDGVPDARGVKPAWETRKRAYLAHLVTADDDTLLVSGCDKLYNARAIVEDLQGIGPAVFERFSAGRAGTLWYYGELAAVFERRGVAIAGALTRTVDAMARLSAA